MDELVQTKLNAQAYEQVWNSSDLNPNLIRSELNKIFTHNKTATESHHDGSNYFDVNWQQLRKSAQSTKVGFWQQFTATLFDFIPIAGALGINVDHQKNTETLDTYHETDYQTISDKYIYDSLQKHDVQVEWTGEKLEPKSFGVFKITELTDRLQTALITKQMMADKNQSAIIRVISTINTPQSGPTNDTHVSLFLTGEVKLYTGVNVPSFPWLLCNGSAISRIQYQRLFAVMGERYGSGDGVHTFNLPDFRGRIPLGVDPYETHVKMAKETGVSGGKTTYQLTPSQIPAHNHSQGSLYVTTNGAHSHSISDPGHNHGGQTGSSGPMGGGRWGMPPSGYGSDQSSHTHTISRDFTGIIIQSAGSHSHTVLGETGSFGNAEPFTVMPPYQTINYIIYAD
jgi:microcystin-dependent protein